MLGQGCRRLQQATKCCSQVILCAEPVLAMLTFCDILWKYLDVFLPAWSMCWGIGPSSSRVLRTTSCSDPPWGKSGLPKTSSVQMQPKLHISTALV